MITYILVAVSILLLIYIVIAFNRLSKRRNQIENAISSLDSLFIQRADLIPNLITTTKEYMNYEQETIAQITQLRTPVVTDKENPYLQSEEGDKTLMNIMASAQFVQLQRAFTECEEQLSAGRRYLSASITDYNDAMVTFPSNVIAAIFGFSKYQWHYATAKQRTAVDAKELFR